MLLRFHIAITETTNTCPTAVCFRSAFLEWKHRKTFGQIQFELHFQCIYDPSIELSRRNIGNTTQMEFVQTCFGVFTRHMSSKKQNRRWTIPRCLGDCNIKTQHHLDNFQMLTPSSVLELHLSTISCRLVEMGWNHWKRKANRNCPNGVFKVRETQGIQGCQITPAPPRHHLAENQRNPWCKIVQCALSPLKRI